MTRRGRLFDTELDKVLDERQRTDQEKEAFERFLKRVEEAFPYLKSDDRSFQRKQGVSASMRGRRTVRISQDS